MGDPGADISSGEAALSLLLPLAGVSNLFSIKILLDFDSGDASSSMFFLFAETVFMTARFSRIGAGPRWYLPGHRELV